MEGELVVAIGERETDSGAGKAKEAEPPQQQRVRTAEEQEDNFASALDAKEHEHAAVMEAKDAEHAASIKMMQAEHGAALEAKDSEHAMQQFAQEEVEELSLEAKEFGFAEMLKGKEAAHAAAIDAKEAEYKMAMATKDAEHMRALDLAAADAEHMRALDQAAAEHASQHAAAVEASKEAAKEVVEQVRVPLPAPPPADTARDVPNGGSSVVRSSPEQPTSPPHQKPPLRRTLFTSPLPPSPLRSHAPTPPSFASPQAKEEVFFTVLKAKEAENTAAMETKEKECAHTLAAKEAEHIATIEAMVTEHAAAMNAKEVECRTALEAKDTEVQQAHEEAVKQQELEGHQEKAVEMEQEMKAAEMEQEMKAAEMEQEMKAAEMEQEMKAAEMEHAALLKAKEAGHRAALEAQKEAYAAAIAAKETEWLAQQEQQQQQQQEEEEEEEGAPRGMALAKVDAEAARGVYRLAFYTLARPLLQAHRERNNLWGCQCRNAHHQSTEHDHGRDWRHSQAGRTTCCRLHRFSVRTAIDHWRSWVSREAKADALLARVMLLLRRGLLRQGMQRWLLALLGAEVKHRREEADERMQQERLLRTVVGAAALVGLIERSTNAARAGDVGQPPSPHRPPPLDLSAASSAWSSADESSAGENHSPKRVITRKRTGTPCKREQGSKSPQVAQYWSRLEVEQLKGAISRWWSEALARRWTQWKQEREQERENEHDRELERRQEMDRKKDAEQQRSECGVMLEQQQVAKKQQLEEQQLALWKRQQVLQRRVTQRQQMQQQDMRQAKLRLWRQAKQAAVGQVRPGSSINGSIPGPTAKQAAQAVEDRVPCRATGGRSPGSPAPR
jgi:hypothetical protein